MSNSDNSINNNMDSLDSNVVPNAVIVNYLPQQLTQEDMHGLFSTVGEVESCKLIRDKVTGQSLGYGFVNFSSEEDAEEAISKLNGLHLHHKTIKVSHARPCSDAIKGANLYVSGLPNDMTQAQLDEMFAPFGKIISSRMLTDSRFYSSGAAKGVGFIRFDQRSQCENAIQKLNGEVLNGTTEPITVKFANPPVTKPVPNQQPPYVQQQQFQGPIHHQPGRFNRYSPMQPPMVPPKYMNEMGGSRPIYVYNIPPDTEEAVLWRLFGPFGAVQNVKLIHDVQTNKCKGYAFVTMTNYEEAIMAIQSLNGYTLNGRMLHVSFKTDKKS